MMNTTIFVFLVTLLYLPMGTIAGELKFPKSEAEFVDALRVKTPDENYAQTRGLSHRGVGGISGQEPPPKAGALITFDYDSAKIKPASYELLNQLGKALNGDLSDVDIIVVGHTDSDGTGEYNLTLSIKRAQAVADYLIYRHRIPEKRLVIRGDGEATPIADNLTWAGKTMNRRVEFIRKQ